VRRVLVLLTALTLLPLSGAGAVQRVTTPAMTCTGTGRVRTCTVHTTLRIRHKTVRVVLPASYGRGRRAYPVVYVLHGVGDDETAWTNPARGNLEALTRLCEAIFVMPDGGSGKDAGWYSDWLDGTYEWERYHVGELPRAVERTFRTDGARAIAGMSMGGFGAMSYAARRPYMFRAAASYSGFLDTTFGAPASGAFYDASGQNDVYSTGAPSRGVWGDQVLDADVWHAHNPYDRIVGLRGTAVYISGGTGVTTPDTAHLPNHAVEAYTRVLTDQFADALDAAGVPYVDGRYDGGNHDWPYWRAAFRDSLHVLMPALDARPC
jgi:S-formylglutathione hydrolase FrmB